MSANYNVVAPIVGSIIAGVAFIAVVALGLIKSGSSVQQMRWIVHLTGALALTVAYANVALKQPQTDRPEGTGTKPVLYALLFAHVVSNTALTLIVSLGIFKSVGARILPGFITFFMFAFLAVGPFFTGMGMWVWLIFACIFYALFILAFLFVDRMDYLAAKVTKKGSVESTSWPGLAWRIGLFVLFAFYFVLWGLSRYVSAAVFSTYTITLILEVVLDVVALVVAFLNYYLVTPVEPDFTAHISELGQSACATAPADQAAPINSSINGQAAAQRRHNGTSNGYTILPGTR